MSKRKKQKCPHPKCEGGFVYECKSLGLTHEERIQQNQCGVVLVRTLCPICQGLTQVRRKR